MTSNAASKHTMRIFPSSPTAELTFTERKVFGLVRDVDVEGAATALSSVNLSSHEHKKWGEVDFILVMEGGLFVVEVKGGGVSCQGGEWRYETKTGVVRKRESPFAQAKGNFYSLEKHLVGHAQVGLAKPMPGGFCVIFAGMRRADLAGIVGGPETPPELSGSAEDIESVAAFRRYLGRVRAFWAGRSRPMPAWDAAMVKKVAAALRPDFDRAVPLALRLSRVREERVQFTNEQYGVLDHLESEPRLLITGGAGCGKTFLAMEVARRAARDGRRVALVTGTETLAGYIRGSTTVDPAVLVMSVAELERQRPPARSVDLLIVDEGQQVTNTETYLLLDELLVAGMECGHWTWFGDYATQVALDSTVDEEVNRLLRNLSSHQRLYQNCRNTPQVISAAETLSGVKLGRALVRGAGPPLHWLAERHRSELPDEAGKQQHGWLTADIAAEDIVLLHASEEGREEATKAASAAGHSTRPWREAFFARSRVPKLCVASIREFRGLESEYVQVFGLDDVESDDELRALAYIAITRATFGASICCSRALKERLMLLSGI